MNMNKRFLIPAFVGSLLTLGFAGCTDDDAPGNTPLPAGTEFDFGGSLETTLTRTYYDPADEGKHDIEAWKIYWNYEADKYDHIYVYSPQAQDGFKQASYTVQATQNLATPAPVVKDDDTGVRTGSATSYNFYAMYPASAVKADSGNGNSLTATMPDKQTASTTEKMSNTAVTELKTTADMNCALMIAKEQFTPTAENPVGVRLNFKPFATMLDITANGTDDNLPNPVRITSVIIEADAPIAGDFTYDYDTESFTFGANASNAITIETLFPDNDGNKVGVMMGNGSKFSVRAFMIPNPDVTTLKVTLVTSASRTMTKSLTMDKFVKSQIHFVNLPKINADKLNLDYTIWLSQLDPNIYLSEISMPGSALSFNYLLSDDLKKTQTKTLTDQFNAGVRVFQCHINLHEDGSSVGIATNTGAPAPKDDGGYWSLTDVLNALKTEMAGIHKDEFCVLTVSDWIAGVTTDNMIELYSRLKTVLDKAEADGLAATGVSPETTIADVKGKVIVKVQLNGGHTVAWDKLTGANVWMNVYAEAAQSQPFYSPMLFGALPAKTAGGTSASALTGDMNIIYNDCDTPVEKNTWNNNYHYKDGVESNATAILAAYADNYDSNQHKNFAMTYLGGCGTSHTTGLFNKVTHNSQTPSEIAAHLNDIWLKNTNKPAQQPWGWVMCNSVGTESTTSQVITAVIEHNADPNFKLKRKANNTKSRPTGDVKGSTNGGSIF